MEKVFTFFGFSPFDAMVDAADGEEFPPLLPSFGLSTDVTLIPFSFVVLEFTFIFDDTGFAEDEDEEFLRAGFPG